MSNKFLELYPQLRDPCVNDRIKVIRILNILYEDVLAQTYRIGDIGVIINVGIGGIRPNRVYEVDFEKYKSALLFKDEFVVVEISNG